MSIKVLIVDDSLFVTEILSRMVDEDPELKVIGTARDGFEALSKITGLKPDVVTLDIEMPKLNGLDCLVRIMAQSPLPVIMVSHLTREGAEPTLQALELGAVDFVTKVSDSDPEAILAIRHELISKLKMAAGIDRSKLKVSSPSQAASRPRSLSEVSCDQLELLVIGASTGGPRALDQLLTLIPKNFPLGVLVAQHMPKDFTKVFAGRLNGRCEMHVSEAQSGEEIKPGKILIAPSGYQTQVVRRDKALVAEVFDYPNQIYKPSVDLLFKSVALACGAEAIGVILTGMGSDGAAGILELRRSGARTIAEDEASCVVFGMPKAAIATGGVEFVESLGDIYSRIVQIMKEPN